MFIVYIILGVLGGILGGMGMGGGTFLIPMLTLICKMEQTQAQGINLLCFIPMAIVSIIFHFKNNLIKSKGILPIIISGTIFSIIGAIIANILDSKKLKIFFAIFLIVLGLYQIISLIYSKIKLKNKYKEK